MFTAAQIGKVTSTHINEGRELHMGNDSVKDKMKGGLNKAKGEVKDKVGDMTDKTDMKAEGKKDKAKGEVQKDIGKAKDTFTDKN